MCALQVLYGTQVRAHAIFTICDIGNQSGSSVNQAMDIHKPVKVTTLDRTGRETVTATKRGINIDLETVFNVLPRRDASISTSAPTSS